MHTIDNSGISFHGTGVMYWDGESIRIRYYDKVASGDNKQDMFASLSHFDVAIHQIRKDFPDAEHITFETDGAKNYINTIFRLEALVLAKRAGFAPAAFVHTDVRN